MKKIEYLKRVINESNLYEYKSWYISAFGILLPKNIDNVEKYEYLELIRSYDGMYTVTFHEGNKVLEKIDDYKENEPLFRFSDVIEIDTSWKINTKEKIETKIGNLILNKVVLYTVLGNKVEYKNGRLNSGTFEEIIVQRLKNDNEQDENSITVKQMVEIIDNLYFFTNIAEIVNISATEKNISAPPNIEQEKQRLLKEFGNDLTDPVKLVEFENKLKELDNEYLKDDPSNGITLTGKSKQARKKMFLVFGSDKDFDEKTKLNPIIETLEEGLNVSEDKFPEYMNSLRFGSFARGKLTAESGTQTKTLLRSLGSITIIDNDCGTTKGIVRNITDKNYKKLLNRRIKEGNKWKVVSSLEEAKKYIDKSVEMRTALYCKTPGNALCYYCTSELFKNTPNAIYHLSTEVSSIMMSMFLKLMHDSSVSNTEIKINDLCN